MKQTASWTLPKVIQNIMLI